MPQDISPSVEPRERLDDLVRRAIAAGADAADAVMFESASLSVAQRLGVSEGIERAESQDLGLRVFRGRRQAVVSSTDVSADALAGLIEDVGVAGVEFGRIVDDVRKASDSLAGGHPCECIFALSRFTIVVHAVDDDIFVALVISPDGNLGKARYLIRRHLIAIREEL